MKVGLSTWAKTDLKEQLDEFIRLKSDFVEMHIDLPLQPDLRFGKLIRKYAQRIPLRVAHLPDLSNDPSYLRTLEGFFAIFHKRKVCQTLVLHFHSVNMPHSQRHQKLRLFKLVKQLADNYGLTLTLENTEESVDEIVELLSRLDCAFTLDIGHANLFAERNRSLDLIKKAGVRLVHVHVSDNLGGDSEAADLHLPIGLGTIRFEPIFRRLHKNGYPGGVTVEVHTHDNDERRGAIATCREAIRNSVPKRRDSSRRGM